MYILLKIVYLLINILFIIPNIVYKNNENCGGLALTLIIELFSKLLVFILCLC